MKVLSRRSCLKLTLASVTTAACGGWAGRTLAAIGPNDKFDLVIKGGEVIDPSQSLRAKRDIGIRFGVIEAVEPDIPAARARSERNRRGPFHRVDAVRWSGAYAAAPAK